MYIISSKTEQTFAIIKDKKEVAYYIDEPYHKVRRLLVDGKGFETEKYQIIIPFYVKIKSNSGGNRR